MITRIGYEGEKKFTFFPNLNKNSSPNTITELEFVRNFRIDEFKVELFEQVDFYSPDSKDIEYCKIDGKTIKKGLLSGEEVGNSEKRKIYYEIIDIENKIIYRNFTML